MSQQAVNEKLQRFFESHPEFHGRGGLSVAIQITRVVREEGLPDNPDALLTARGGQVRGLSGGNLRSILRDYGITRQLAAEGGRTSRGSIDLMRTYVAFLQDLADEVTLTDEAYSSIERFWANQVQAFFDSEPFELNLDASLGLSAFVREVLQLARERQQQGGGTMVVGTVLQHLVGAKLELAIRGSEALAIEHHSASTADAQTARAGDFLLGDSAIHVTTAPGEVVMARAKANLRSGLRPIIVTLGERTVAARQAAEIAEIADRVDIFEVEQFVALNVYEWSGFSQSRRQTTVTELLEVYNRIVAEYENDPSLRILLR